MPAVVDEAVVLRLSEFSETSQIVTLCSAAHGQVRLIAKGARRSTKSRFVAGLDLLEYGEVGFIAAHGDAGLGTLTDWTQRDAFAGLRRDLARLFGGLYAAELAAGLTQEYDPHPELFAALLDLLRTLADPAAPPPPAVATFQAALLAAIGYAPNLHACVACGKVRAPGAAAHFSPRAGGLLCRACAPQDPDPRRLSAALLDSTPATGDDAAWFAFYDHHLTYIAGRPFKTAARLGRLLRAPR